MATKKPDYIVQAFRWGDREGHSYFVGTYSNKVRAFNMAKLEEEYRGGKYECEVYEVLRDSAHPDGRPGQVYRIVKALPIIPRNAKKPMGE